MNNEEKITLEEYKETECEYKCFQCDISIKKLCDEESKKQATSEGWVK